MFRTANPTVLVTGRSYSRGGQQGGQAASWNVKGQATEDDAMAVEARKQPQAMHTS